MKQTVYTKDTLRYTGNLAQLGGTKHYEFLEGSAKGTYAVDVDTGTGFSFTVVPDRGIDISRASYKGKNLVYLTPNNEVNPAYYNPQGSEWLRTFFGGLLTTCGLTYFGGPCEDNGEALGLHGRYSVIPAKRFADTSHWEGDSYIIELSGMVEDAVLFGDKVRLTRLIRSGIGERKLIITDTIENFGFKNSPFVILYHINPGFPLVDEHAELVLSAADCEPYDGKSRNNIANARKFGKPVPEFQEENFLYTMIPDRDGFGYAAMINRTLLDGIGLYIKFDTAHLPFLSEWKMIGECDYVVGIEPVSQKIESRAVLRESGRLRYLKAGEARTITVEIGVLDGSDEIERFIKKVDTTLRDKTGTV
jgi:hypothetical protein